MTVTTITLEVKLGDEGRFEARGQVFDENNAPVLNQTVSIEIIDGTETVVQTSKLGTGVTGTFSSSIPVKTLSDGTYTVRARIGDIISTPGEIKVKDGKVYEVSSPERPETVPGEPAETPGPQLQECTFPAFTANLWAYFGGLFQWLGCIVKNIIIIVQWIADWLLHFGDHLDTWISALFGIDPALPFFDELMKKIDIWISNRLGVDPALPLLDELIRKTFAWLFGAMDEASRERLKRM